MLDSGCWMWGKWVAAFGSPRLHLRVRSRRWFRRWHRCRSYQAICLRGELKLASCRCGGFATMRGMRTALIVLAMVVVLGWARSATALVELETRHDYTFRVGESKFGFSDGHAYGSYVSTAADAEWDWSYLHLGPLGRRQVPFSATQGLVGLCALAAALIVVSAILMVRWKRREAFSHGADP
jgi:hypothetical protein